jgi:hypothetical protein
MYKKIQQEAVGNQILQRERMAVVYTKNNQGILLPYVQQFFQDALVLNIFSKMLLKSPFKGDF